MKYLGGKYRLGKKLAAAIVANTDFRGTLIEPFVGGGSMTPHLAKNFRELRIGDAHRDLVLMWQAVYDGWEPPTEVSEELYRELRRSGSSALRGFVGFGCSFGGKWFGGYGRSEGRNYADESARNVKKIVQDTQHTLTEIALRDYRDWGVGAGDVVYCDPPYIGTTGFSGTEAFDHEEFYTIVEGWVLLGADVFVSEYTAPDHWTEILSTGHRQSVGSAADRKPTVEKLFKVKPRP